MNYRKIFCVLIISALLAAWGCKKKEATPPPAAEKPKPAGTVLAEVGELKITDLDVKEEIAMLPEQLKALVETKEGKKELVEGLVNREMLFQEAKAKGLENDEKVKKEIEKFKKRVLVESFLRDKLGSDDKVDEKELQEYFKKNEKEYKPSDKVRAKHIIVKDKKTADDIYKKVKKTPKDFESLATENNIDPSGKQGGDLGEIETGALVPEFQQALEKLKKPGEISPVIKTQFGFHIIKLVGRQKAKGPKYEEVKDYVKAAYLKERQKAKFEAILAELKKKYTSKINEDAVAKLGNEPQK